MRTLWPSTHPGETVSMAERHLRCDGTNDQVRVIEGQDETVTVELGQGSEAITLVGHRYDVYRMILEADRQLSRLSYPQY